MNSIHY